MAIKKITISEFFQLRNNHVVLDVRSPSEYAHAHILGAISFPLFSDEERKVVGTAYKQESREQAIKLGLDYFGVKMRSVVEAAEELVVDGNKRVVVHCWRGGMRSAAIAWLLDLYGFDVSLIVGGYKSYRRWANNQFEQPYPFYILSGYTGSGKTLVLEELKKRAYEAIDLEGLAKHRGSSFGGMEEPQPSQEMFENLLAESLAELRTDDNAVWVEDESQRIGNLNIPPKLWQTMRSSPIFLLDVPFEERLKHIVEEYGVIDKDELINATIRIQKRLGGLETKTCIVHLQNGNIIDGFRILLKYYDKHYLKAFNKRDLREEDISRVVCEEVEAENNTKKLLECRN